MVELKYMGEFKGFSVQIIHSYKKIYEIIRVRGEKWINNTCELRIELRFILSS